jgi:hypothetical protein
MEQGPYLAVLGLKKSPPFMQLEGSSPSSEMPARYVMCYEMQMVFFWVVDLRSVSAVLKRFGFISSNFPRR